MSDTMLERSARGKLCLVRLPGCAGMNTETVVLAHFRMLPYSGTGKKPPSYLGARACDSCHSIVDGRKKLEGWTRPEIELAHAQGVMRTHVEYEREGLLWRD